MKYIFSLIVLLSLSSAAAKPTVQPWARFTLQQGHASDGANGVRLKSIQFIPVKETTPLDLDKCAYDLFYCGASDWLPSAEVLCKPATSYYKSHIPSDSESEFGAPTEWGRVRDGARVVHHKNLPSGSTNLLTLEMVLTSPAKGKFAMKALTGKYFSWVGEGKGSFGEKKQYSPVTYEMGDTHWELSLRCK